VARCAACLMLLTLAACSIAPGQGTDDAYWKDQRWDGDLLDAVQSNLHYPLDANGQPVQPIPQEAQATVGFTYADGRIQDPKIIESSGRQDLDAAFLAQVVTADAPKAHGSHAAEAHPFELVLEMPTPLEAFEVGEKIAINAQRIYPQNALGKGIQGVATVGFKYQDGRAHNITIVKSSGDPELDRESMRSVREARLPSRPTWMSEEPQTMRISICYSLGDSDICPKRGTVLEVSDPSKDSQPASPPSGP
jgi:TonB family protein